jgi:hypothetical protein
MFAAIAAGISRLKRKKIWNVRDVFGRRRLRRKVPPFRKRYVLGSPFSSKELF